MKREIKFRVYDTYLQKYTYLVHVNDFDHPERICEQFTGLTDKNGVDIYEGDICYHDRHDIKSLFIWNNDYICFLGKSKIANHFYQQLDSDALTIIGNIHQNPELK